MRSEEHQSPANVPLQKSITQIALNQRPHTQMAITISSANLSWIRNGWGSKNSSFKYFLQVWWDITYSVFWWFSEARGLKIVREVEASLACMPPPLSVARASLRSLKDELLRGSDNVHPRRMNDIHSFWCCCCNQLWTQNKWISVALFFNSNNSIP